MLDSVIELVKFVGGLAGLASSAFLVYDRIFRNRPAAFLFPADYKTSPLGSRHCARATPIRARPRIG
jgi:hypothetical protein